MAASNDEDDAFEDLRHDDGNSIWKIFRQYGHGYRMEFALGGVAGVVSRLLELVPALILGIAVDTLLRASGQPFGVPLIPQAWIPETTMGQLWLATGIIGGTYLFGAVLNWANSWAWNHFAQHLQHEVRTDTYNAMQDLGLAFFDNKQTGEVMSVLNNDVNQLENFLTNNLNGFIRTLVWVLGAAAMMLLLNWQLALIPVVLIPLLGVASVAFVRRIQPKYQKVRSSVGQLNSRLENNLGGITVVKAYNNERFESGRVEDASREYLDSQWDAITTRIKFFPTLQIITAVGYVATFLVGSVWVIRGPVGPLSGTLTAGTLVTFLLYSRRFMWPMRQFGQIINSYQYAEAAAERIVGLMDEPRTIQDREDAIELDGVEGRVEYDGVSFGYPDESPLADLESGGGAGGRRGPGGGPTPDPDENGAPRRPGDGPVLTDVSFTAEPGEYVGLVGPTGAGKTTLLKLLLRMYDVDEGAVRVDGHDVRDVTLESLRDSISYVSQEPYLFYGTVRENIAYGHPDIPEADVVEAAKRAGAHEFVDELPDGYDTMVGERGVKLSGGQRQRVSIARAVLKDPDVLVLDEATSHVDNETEMLIQNSLGDIIENRTTFAIAHRLSTVRDADRILVMDDGELVEEGSHEELLAEDGLYANLWSVQVGEISDLPEEFVERAARRQARAGDTDD